MPRFSRLLHLFSRSRDRTSHSEQEMVLVNLSSIKTLQESYKTGILKAIKSPKYPHKPTHLDRVSVWQGNITHLEVDSIVNAANRHLGGGAGVNGAIQQAAGPDLLDECEGLGGCDPGLAKITKGYRLPVKHVIHAVGPIYSSRDVDKSANQLRSCYGISLGLAVENNLKHIAFPSLSTGIYGYPIDDATHIALDATRNFLDTPDGDKLDLVIFVVWSDKDRDVYRDLIPHYFPGPQEEEPTQDEPTLEPPAQGQPTQELLDQNQPPQDQPTQKPQTEDQEQPDQTPEEPAKNQEQSVQDQEQPTQDKEQPAQGQEQPTKERPTSTEA